MDRWTADQINEQAGRTFIVTGGNSGLGFETTRQLAAHGGRVLLAARSPAKGHDAVARLKVAQPGPFRKVEIGGDSDQPSNITTLFGNQGCKRAPTRIADQTDTVAISAPSCLIDHLLKCFNDCRR